MALSKEQTDLIWDYCKAYDQFNRLLVEIRGKIKSITDAAAVDKGVTHTGLAQLMGISPNYLAVMRHDSKSASPDNLRRFEAFIGGVPRE